MTNGRFPRRKVLHLAVGATAFALAASTIIWFANQAAWSQTLRTIKLVVPFAPGGGGSVLARLFGDQIERTQMVTMLLENRPGAATVVGTEAVARAASDGTTVLITNEAILTNPHLRKQNYDPFLSFEPVCRLAETPLFIVVNSSSPYRSLTEFLNAARADAGKLTMATFVGTAPHIGLELLKYMAKVDITFVPFPGSTPAVSALLGGHVTALFDNYATVAEHVRAGNLRVLATSSPARVAAFPEVPTVAEAGYAGYAIETWWGAFAPAHTPIAAVTQLSRWFSAASQAPEIAGKLAPLGFYPAGICGAEFTALVRKTDDNFGRAMRDANMKVE